VVAEIVPAVPVTDEEFETENGALGSGLDSIVVPTVVVGRPVPKTAEVLLLPVPVGLGICVELRVGKGARPVDSAGVVPALTELNPVDPVGVTTLVTLVSGKRAEVLVPMGSTPLSSVAEPEGDGETLVAGPLKLVELAVGRLTEADSLFEVVGAAPVPKLETVPGDVPVGPDNDVALVKEKGVWEPGGRGVAVYLSVVLLGNWRLD